MYAQEATHCCAVHEFQGLNDDDFTPEKAMKMILSDLWCPDRDQESPTCAMYFLAQKWYCREEEEVGTTNLNALVSYIDKNKLGDVTLMDTVVNPNTGNMIKVGFYEPEPDATRQWAEQQFYLDTSYDGY